MTSWNLLSFHVSHNSHTLSPLHLNKFLFFVSYFVPVSLTNLYLFVALLIVGTYHHICAKISSQSSFAISELCSVQDIVLDRWCCWREMWYLDSSMSLWTDRRHQMVLLLNNVLAPHCLYGVTREPCYLCTFQYNIHPCIVSLVRKNVKELPFSFSSKWIYLVNE